MEKILLIIVIFVTIKAITIGSDFSFKYFFRDGREYLIWYKNRPDYESKGEQP